jgi:hypothetical protein
MSDKVSDPGDIGRLIAIARETFVNQSNRRQPIQARTMSWYRSATPIRKAGSSCE